MKKILLSLFVATQLSAAEEKNWGAWLDMRPSWNVAETSAHLENEIGAEYKLQPETSVGYTQEFFLRLNPTLEESATDYYRTRLGDGYLFANFSSLLDLGDNLTFAYEPRVYLPTSGLERIAGLIFSTRHYLKLEWEVTSQLSFAFAEIPILSLQDRAGYESGDELIANTLFENRVEAGPELSFFEGTLKISLPLILQARRLRDFDPGAAGNASWIYYLWVAPEALYKVGESTHVGVAYYSDSIAGDGVDGVEIGNGFANGTFQMVLQQTL